MSFFEGGFGSVLGLGGAILGRSWAKSDASKMRNWQESMRSTAHQVEVDDLRKAGLNPVLSVNAGAPMGSAAAPVNPNIAGSAAAGATAENMTAIAMQNKVKAAFDKKKLDYFDRHPEIQDIVSGGKIANDSGLPAMLGAGASTLGELWKDLRDKWSPQKPKGKPERKSRKEQPKYRGGRMIPLTGNPQIIRR